ncbi:helix-turn-helix transcriptional regulator [Riemerella columbipharyngis]|nr:helix-turn-helix transcriptional regulator [Riemerella columbipharyngis]
MESGRTNPSIYTLYRIAEALEVPLEELINMR